MHNRSEKVDFYDRLKGELRKTSKWPDTYLFKFIVPTDDAKIKAIRECFSNYPDVVFEEKTSGKGSYTGVSVKVMMQNPDQVVSGYRSVSHIDGIISM